MANKMTGEKGVLFTAAYVTAFEKMREHIQSGRLQSGKDTRAEAMLNNSRARLASEWRKLAKLKSWPLEQVNPNLDGPRLTTLSNEVGPNLDRLTGANPRPSKMAVV